MPTQRLTKSFIDALKASERDQFYWDQSVPGFGLKITPRGAKSFVIQYRDNRNRSKRLTISTPALMSLEDVRNDARRKLQQARDGIDPAQARLDRIREPTVNEIIDRWDKNYVATKLIGRPSAKNAACEATQLRTWLGQLQVSTINRELLMDWHAEPNQKRRPYAANRLIKRLSWIWEWCEINNVLPPSAPSSNKLFNKFPFYPEEGRTRVLSADEYRALARAMRIHRERDDLNRKHLALFELLLLAGSRLREIMNLRYDRGDRDDTNYLTETDIVLQRHKTWRKARTKRVPITPEIRAVLDGCAEFRQVGNPYLFPADRNKDLRGPIKDPYDTFYKLIETAGITGTAVEQTVAPKKKKKGARRPQKAAPGHTRIHDLRRSLISFGINNGGVSLDAMAKTIGHADPQTTREHYYVLSAAERRQNMEKTTSRLAKLIKT